MARSALKDKVLGYFDACYLINLDRRTDRLKESAQELAMVGIRFERFSAVEPTTEQYPGRINLDLGRIGCGLSHKAVIQKAKDSRAESVLIFEDDILLAPDFKESVDGVIDDLKCQVWDIFYLYCENVPRKDLTDHLFVIAGQYFTHAYAVHCRFYDRFLEEYLPLRDQVVDMVDGFLPRVNAIKVASKKYLAAQREGFSDIESRFLRRESPLVPRLENIPVYKPFKKFGM